jgi:hypothetical protein
LKLRREKTVALAARPAGVVMADVMAGHDEKRLM